MRVTSLMIFNNSALNVNDHYGELFKLNEQVSSGKRINRPSDDPVDVGKVSSYKTLLDSINQYSRNIDRGVSLMRTTESALASIEEVLIEAKVLAEQMATGTYSEEQREMLSLQTDLENTAIAAGVPYNDLLRDIGSGGTALLGILGFDVEKYRDVIAKYDRLNKLFADGIIESVDRFTTEGGGSGSITDSKMALLTKSSPSMQVSASSNAQLIADRIEAVLDAAETDGIEIDGRAEMEEWVEEIRKGSLYKKDGGRDIGVTVDQVKKMTVEQLQELAQSGIELSAEIENAAYDRWAELNGE